MQQIFSQIISLLTSLSLVLTGVGVELSKIQEPQIKLGADANAFFGGFPYYLAGSGITSSATSFTAVSLTIPQNSYPIQDTDLSSTFYITFEPGSKTRQEFASCTTMGTNTGGNVTVSGCTRGLSAISPYTASTTQRFSHAGGTSFIFSNSPAFYDTFASVGNSEAITGLYTFNTVLPTTSLTATTSSQFVTKGYVDGGILAGAATATESVTGIVRLATGLQGASSTASTANTPLVLQAQNATSTYNSATAPLKLVVTDNSGKIDGNFIDTTENYTWSGDNTLSGINTFNSTTTFSATTTFNGIITGKDGVVALTSSTTITGSTLPQPVYIATSTGAINLSDANSAVDTNFIGFAVSNANNGQTVYVQTSGIVTGFTGLTVGSNYYVQDAVGTIGTSIGTSEVFVGQAVSSTSILIQSRSYQYLSNTGNVTITSTATSSVPFYTREIVVYYQNFADNDIPYSGTIVLKENGIKTVDVNLCDIGTGTCAQNGSVTMTWGPTNYPNSLVFTPSGTVSSGQVNSYFYR